MNTLMQSIKTTALKIHPIKTRLGSLLARWVSFKLIALMATSILVGVGWSTAAQAGSNASGIPLIKKLRFYTRYQDQNGNAGCTGGWFFDWGQKFMASGAIPLSTNGYKQITGTLSFTGTQGEYYPHHAFHSQPCRLPDLFRSTYKTGNSITKLATTSAGKNDRFMAYGGSGATPVYVQYVFSQPQSIAQVGFL